MLKSFAKKAMLLLSLTTLVACEEKKPIIVGPSPGATDAVLSLGGSSGDGGELVADAVLLDWSPPEPDMPMLTREEICAQVPMDRVEEYCDCYPSCCQNQRWYCPPNPRQTIDIMTVVVEICDDDKVPCEFGLDPGCPPPEILSRSECYTAWECPPGSRGEFVEWFECQLEDGTLGRQRVLCDKGNLEHGPCRPCEDETCDGEDNDCDGGIDEGRFPCSNQCGDGWGFCIDQVVVDCTAEMPREEICNFEDDDCDELIDEGQRNACDQCGPVPPDDCDGVDNDCDGTIDEELVQECETVCERGVETCEDGNWISCTAQIPIDEECDGEDNDCDGLIDEQLECLCTAQDVGNLMPCSEPPLLCGQGFKTCECVDENCTRMRLTDCAALCTYVPQPPPCNPRVGITLQREECNNFDEDCDMLIDEELRQTCYTGDPDTLFVGVCVPGEVYCERGIWGNDRNDRFEPGFCSGEITPSEEVCDGADNDCDGEVDYGEEIRDTDLLFIVDWSGSMADEIDAVKVALNRFSQHFAAEEPLQWGLIVGPKQLVQFDETLVLVSDISPFEQFLAAFAALGNDGMNTGQEMLLDALYLSINNISGDANIDIPAARWTRNTASQPEKENFSITWRPEASRIVIVFTDEPEQSFLNPAITHAQAEAAARAGINLKVYTFTTPSWNNSWVDIALASGGTNFNLSSDALSMYNDLMSIIDEACLPREEAIDAQEDEEQAQTTSFGHYVYASYNYGYDYVRGLCY